MFVDFRKAFDSIDRKLLYQLLWDNAKSNEEKYMFKLIYDIFSNTTLEYNNAQIKTSKGVFQGSVLAPLLFNFYLDHALKSNDVLRNAINNGSLYAFADDIVIKFSTQIQLNWYIDALKSIESTFKLKIHPGKTQFICESTNF